MEYPKILNFMHHFSDREWKTLQDAVEYAKDPFGDVGHNLKMVLAKLVEIIEDSPPEISN